MLNHIIVVEDDPNIRNIVEAYLKKEGYRISVAETAELALELAEKEVPDMWIMDIMLPGMDGYALCNKIRQTSEVPIIIISAKDEEIDRILGLELGGDDYLTKPFSPRELVARVKRLFKRWNPQTQPDMQAAVKQMDLEAGDLQLHLGERRVYWHEEEVEVTAKEFEMIVILVQNPNRAFSRDELLTQVWGEDYFGSDRAVDDLVKRLRKKMEGIPIETVWGFGYRFRMDEE
ncbi:two-component system, OmpR family, response regulator CssR [Terribacillus aidingensis]|uniref:Two-component system, OmpR family, response regulator CssR n=1 Tax=Terribacillus aidingensis TaxID=586416 RepID=A0A285P5R7_9BACI|nr:response regulator transcription factor [Terribacillus aidingensis]SNZ16788.1 two-component system, OmpR family, response regulator CssR [Terribacillus aidingensis]